MTDTHKETSDTGKGGGTFTLATCLLIFVLVLFTLAVLSGMFRG